MRRQFINYPTNRLLAVVDDRAAARALAVRLIETGVAGELSLWRGPEPDIAGIWRR